MADAILPSGPDASRQPWSTDHLRLHRTLLRQPELLPRGAALLLAVSGGQDSMAMTGLLRDLQRLHGWRLSLWHGDHGWRPESAEQARQLDAWARRQGLPIRIERADGSWQDGNREAAARRWRYGCLARQARRLGCTHVLTAHTATDRAETVLLHLARGSHRRGLAALRRRLPLSALGLSDGDAPTGSQGELPAAGAGSLPDRAVVPGPLPCQQPAVTAPWLVRPLQMFTRQDTAALCRRYGWPVWTDPGNDALELSRNRIRVQVLPVLESLHPGACRRISDQAERLAAEEQCQQELLELALIPLRIAPLQLDRRALLQLSPASQSQLLQHWLERSLGAPLPRRSLATLLPRLALERGPGLLALAGGWQLGWRGTTLALLPPDSPQHGHG